VVDSTNQQPVGAAAGSLPQMWSMQGPGWFPPQPFGYPFMGNFGYGSQLQQSVAVPQQAVNSSVQVAAALGAPVAASSGVEQRGGLPPSDQADRRPVSTREPTCVLPVFKEDGNVTTFLSMFDYAAKHYGWSESEQDFQLRSRIEGPAADLVCAQAPATLADLKHLLLSSYGQQGKQRQIRIALSSRKRKEGETLQSLCADIRKSLSTAYPTSDAAIRDSLAQDYFIKALDSKLRERILIRGVNSLDEALSCALEFDQLEFGCKSSDTKESSKQSNSNWHKKPHHRARRANHKSVSVNGSTANSAKSTASTVNSSSSSSITPEMLRTELKSILDGCLAPQREDVTVNAVKERVLAELGHVRQQSVSDSDFHNHARRKRFSNEHEARYKRGECFNCGKTGHKAFQCRAPKRNFDAARDRSPLNQSVSGNKTTGALRAVDAEAYLIVKIGDRKREAILDSGCTHSILPYKWVPYGTKIEPISVKTTTADNRQVAMIGQADVHVLIGSQIFVINVWLSDKVSQFLLGYDWLGDSSVKWCVGSDELIARGEIVKVNVRSVGGDARRVYCAKTVEIPSNHHCVVGINCPQYKDRSHTAWMINAGVLSNNTVSARVVLSTLDCTAGVLITNVSDEPVVVLEGTPLGIAESIQVTDSVFSAEGNPLPSGQARTVSQIDECPDSVEYDSDLPNEWESEIDWLSSRPIDELLSSRPVTVTSPQDDSEALDGHSR
jgi:hypothetical protein